MACEPRAFADGGGGCGPEAAFGTHSAYDPAGKVASTTRYRAPGVALTTTFAYDASANTVAATNAAGHTTTWAYDPLERKVSETKPRAPGESHTTEYRYDPSGNTTALTRPGGLITAYAYDAANRLTETVWVCQLDLAPPRWLEVAPPNGA